MTVSILIADDHYIVRHGLRSLLEAEQDFVIVGEAADGLETIELAERLKPDVLVVDLMMPGLNALEVTREVRQSVAQARIVVLSMYATEAYVVEALRVGAAGYVLKDATASELVHAVREVVAGRRYLSAPLSEHAIDAYVQKASQGTLDLYETLTAREREVLHLTAEGHSSADIAKRLCISSRTVETHRAHILRKLNLRTHTDLIRYALKRGILPME